MTEPLQYLGIGAHPDDIEIGCGAFLLKMKRRGHRTGMVILTGGDMGSGTPEGRREETGKAARDLEVDALEILDLGDTRLVDDHDSRVVVAALIRKYRPQIVLAPYYGIEPGRGRGHADHIACGHLATHAANFAHLEKYPAQGSPHAVKKIFYYFLQPYLKPSFIVPVDEEFPIAMRALAHHGSQFDRPGRPSTIQARLEASAAALGAQVEARYGQAFYVPDVPRVEDPLGMF
ncbi:MAG: PIG-L family deacetylase [Spirochaetes bacterium]|nr:PIG-L family deacetylase [Spirochaetota bacterium]